MSLASELLHSTSKRRERDGSKDGSYGPVRRLLTLDHVVHGLISEHEPPVDTEVRLRADLRLMHLSGLVCNRAEGVVTSVCRQAAGALAELIRLLPRCRQ